MTSIKMSNKRSCLSIYNNKEEIKKDGFSIGKDKDTDNWIIKYWLNISNDTNLDKWELNFNEKCKKWEQEIENN